MKRSRTVFIYVAVLTVVSMLAGCRHDSTARDAMNDADLLIESRPDSSLAILKGIDPQSLRGDEERARYALLMSMALDKNYIDTTTFDVLQPAIDYYLKKGTPDERLRTLYYQGCIYRNRGDDANAMASCIDALDLKYVTDTLVLARAYVAQATLYYRLYKAADFAAKQLKAAELYLSQGDDISATRCYAKALNGAVLSENKEMADSLVEICHYMMKLHPEMEEYVNMYLLSYALEYGSDEALLSLLKQFENYELNADIILSLAEGYAKVGDTATALSLIDYVNLGSESTDSLKYYIIKMDVCEKAGDIYGALEAHKRHLYVSELVQAETFSKDLLFAEKKHQIEIDNLVQVQKRDRLINYGLFVIIGLLIVSIVIFYRYYVARTRRMAAEQDNLKLKLEKQKAELELDNMRLEKAELDAECYKLKNLLTEQNELAEPIRAVIKQRFDLLNGLLAKDISENETYADPYKKWIDHVRQNKDEFMESTRLAFTASHPAFIDYLTARGLTADEIRYVCLYAIGLKGKEVGVYLQLKGHYNISSAIRKKLGMGEHDTNLGIYIKRLMNECCR